MLRRYLRRGFNLRRRPHKACTLLAICLIRQLAIRPLRLLARLNLPDIRRRNRSRGVSRVRQVLVRVQLRGMLWLRQRRPLRTRPQFSHRLACRRMVRLRRRVRSMRLRRLRSLVHNRMVTQ